LNCSCVAFPSSSNIFSSKIFHPRNRGSNESAQNRQSRRRELDLNRQTLDSIPEMALEPDTIFKALRPVPEFDGNVNVLTRFIRICDQLVHTYISNLPGSELNNLCLINGILNKITGPAARTINSNGIPDNWLGIRNALINNFSDQRDETALYNDLSLVTQGNSSPQEFYDHCQTLFSTIMTYVSLHETLDTTIEAKRTLYKKLTMQAFVRGLREPLGSRIRCMRPETIEKALEYVQEELNILYMQQRNDSAPKTHSSKPFNLPPSNMQLPKPIHYQPPMPNWNNMPMQRLPSQPQMVPRFMPPGQPFKFNTPPNQFQHPTRQPGMPSRTQQMFRALPNNYNPQSNMFRLNRSQAPQASPTPMSGVQRYIPKTLPPTISGHDWRRYGNPPPNNYFKSREMHVNECIDNSYNDFYYEPDYNNYYDYNNYTYYDDNAPTYSDSYYSDDNDVQYDTLAHEPPPSDKPQASSSVETTQDFHLEKKYSRLK
jgi:hypothetical protein